MVEQDWKIIKAHNKFKELLKDVKIERIRNNKSDKILSDKRLTLAIARVPKLKEILINREIKDEKNK